MGRPVLRSWREIRPKVGHDNAIVYKLLDPVAKGDAGAGGGGAAEAAEAAPNEAARCLQRVTGVAKHMLQPGMKSDYHVHPNAEQVYYVLRGRGALIVDDERYPVREGDTIYLPAGVRHQAVNEGDDWMEHLIVTARLD
jgi:quercetin dioxygenase-like cupin family protein